MTIPITVTHMQTSKQAHKGGRGKREETRGESLRLAALHLLDEHVDLSLPRMNRNGSYTDSAYLYVIILGLKEEGIYEDTSGSFDNRSRRDDFSKESWRF